MPPQPQERILPYAHVLIRLPSNQPKIHQVIPDTTISLGKFGAFPANSLLYRPYNHTYDILDAPAVGLRLVPPLEVTRDILGGVGGASSDSALAPAGADESHYDLPYAPSPGGGESSEREDAGTPTAAAAGTETMRTNQHTTDNSLSQTLTWEEIEALKTASTGANSGRALIQKLLAGHSNLHQKTPFALQKYTLRKSSKFLKRFSVHPVTIDGLGEWLTLQKDPSRFLEIRTAHLGLMLSLANVVWGGRYLVVDETGGLLVAAVAERLGLLEIPPTEPEPEAGGEDGSSSTTTTTTAPRRPRVPLAERNTITLLHANEQPNLSLLQHFGYDANTPSPTHPFYTHLKSLSYLQLLHPELETSLVPPPAIPEPELQSMKQGKRAAHARKMRRWERIGSCVADTRRGGFDAVLVAAHIGLAGVLRAVVPLVRGSGMVVAYAPTVEMGAEVVDWFSSARKAVRIGENAKAESVRGGTRVKVEGEERQGEEGEGEEEEEEEEEKDPFAAADDLPDPTLLLAPTLHRIAARRYQVLPGRTHPVMTSRGGSEGVVFCGTRVIPVHAGAARATAVAEAEGAVEGTAGVEINGSPLAGKKRKQEELADGSEDQQDQGTGKKLELDPAAAAAAETPAYTPREGEGGAAVK